MKTPLAAFVVGLAFAVGAADIPWTYDDSRRAEPNPSSDTSAAVSLRARAFSAVSGIASWLFSRCRDVETSSPGIDLTTVPKGSFVIIR